MNKKLSIVVPIYNEEINIPLLYERIVEVLNGLAEYEYEIIIVNDGSCDGSGERIDRLSESDHRVKAVHFKRNYGQTAAMMAGFDMASGDIIVPIDGDLQNDPADIPRLLKRIENGYDVCSGWRVNRKDHTLRRNVPSKIANWLISKISGVHLHDYGCSLKAYRREVLEGVRLYGEMHRFIPIYASWQGAKVTEIPVRHHQRIHGESKYGIGRTTNVILDLILVKFLSKYSQKPLHAFGGFALFCIMLSFISFGGMLYFRFFLGATFIQTPLPLLAVLFFLMGFQSLFMGLIGEMIMRTYFESQKKLTYMISKTNNFKED